jgi:hypothetical protein
MPARLALEKGDWKQAAKVDLRPAADSYPWNKYPQAEAVNAFARGVGAARAGDPAAAKQEHARLIKLRDVAKERKLAYWAEQIDINAEVVRGLVAAAEGDRPAGMDVIKAAAAREDATEKHAVTPGPVVPAREVLAELLLEAKNAREALREFEAVLAKEPNRYRALSGAIKAARLAGEGKKTQDLSAQLGQLTKSADASAARRKPRSLRRASYIAQPRRVAAARTRSFDTPGFWSRLQRELS